MSTLGLRDLAFLGGLGGGAAGDPNTLLLLRGDSAPIVDSSTYARPVTASGSPAPSISSAQSQFGGSSILFPNTLGSLLTVPSDALFAFGTGDFTVEAFLRQSSPRNGFAALLEIGNHLNNTGIIFLVGNNGVQIYSNGFFGSSTALAFNTFNHVAWVRQSGILSMYLGGTRTSTIEFARDLTATGPVTIGSSNPAGNAYNDSYRLNSYVDEMRVHRGALYSGATITVPSSPLTP